MIGKGILDGDPGLDRARARIERRLARSLLAALGMSEKAVVRAARSQKLGIVSDVDLWNKVYLWLFGAMLPSVEDAAMLGMEMTAAQVGIGVDWTLVNIDAVEWARHHCGDLVTKIDERTKLALQQHITSWMESGEPLPKLTERLERAKLFGRQRADLIASTEVTNAFAEGQLQAAAKAGMDVIPPRERPAKHPRCRCWLTMRKREDGRWVWVWQTVAMFGEGPGSVCPICEPLHGQDMV